MISKNVRYYIYLIKNIVNDKKYIGITCKSVHARWTGHVNHAKSGRGSALHAAIRKHGLDKFFVSELACCKNSNDACFMEKYFIKEFSSKGSGGYNMTDGGESSAGREKTASQREKEAKYWTAEARAAHSIKLSGVNNPMYGKVGHTRGKVLKRGIDSPNYGRHMKQDAKDKMSCSKRIKEMRRRLNSGLMMTRFIQSQSAKRISALIGNNNVKYKYVIMSVDGECSECLSIVEFSKSHKLDHSTMQKTFKNGKYHTGSRIVKKDRIR